jgi:CxxC motif-containing protein
MGCRLTVTMESTTANTLVVTGNRCNRGKAYAIEEMTNPTRILPTTVVIKQASFHRLPVKTEYPIPKALLMEAMQKINEVVVTAPVNRGDVIIENLLGTGINVVASRSMKRI